MFTTGIYFTKINNFIKFVTHLDSARGCRGLGALPFGYGLFCRLSSDSSFGKHSYQVKEFLFLPTCYFLYFEH